MPTRRTSRVNTLLQEELSELIHRELRDPRLAEITSITHVDVSPDLRLANVYVSILGSEQQKERTIEGLQAAAAFLHRALKGRITMKNIPMLTFRHDDSIESGARLLALMQEISRTGQPPADKE